MPTAGEGLGPPLSGAGTLTLTLGPVTDIRGSWPALRTPSSTSSEACPACNLLPSPRPLTEPRLGKKPKQNKTPKARKPGKLQKARGTHGASAATSARLAGGEGNRGQGPCLLCRAVSGKPRVECLLRVTHLEPHQQLWKHCSLGFSQTHGNPGRGGREHRQRARAGGRSGAPSPRLTGEVERWACVLVQKH